MIKTRILADSINPKGTRLTSWLLTYPRFIHSEFMTHRVFSRSAASSRAISFKKMMADVRDTPALPEKWAGEQKGMQGGDEITGESLDIAQHVFHSARMGCLGAASIASEQAGLHKSLANRILEPWAHITVLATATDHSNFFTLRAHPAAMPEFQVLAYRMLANYLTSEPRPLKWGEWHVPNFMPSGTMNVDPLLSEQDRLKVAVAHCARLSYLTHDGEFSVDADLDLFRRLFGPPMHAGAFEHVAQAINPDNDGFNSAFRSYPWSNFDLPGRGGPSGWGQYRKLFEQECALNLPKEKLFAILGTKPDWISL